MKHEWVNKTQCSLCLVHQTPELADDNHCSGNVTLHRFGSFVQSDAGAAYDQARGLVRRPDGAIPKEALRHGVYYYGRCRNASIARWDAVKQVFVHWRSKFGSVFTEEISCREDEAHADVFDPFLEIEDEKSLNAIPVSKFPIQILDGEPCEHPGCLSHVSHPCEGCGRVAGRIPTS